MPQITYASLVFSGFNSKRYYSFLSPPISNVRYPKSNHSFVDGNFEFNEFNDEYISSFSTVPACFRSGNWQLQYYCDQFRSTWKNIDTGELRHYVNYMCFPGPCIYST